VYLATDDPAVVRRAQAKAREWGFVFYYLPIARARYASGPDAFNAAAASVEILLDVLLLAECRYFAGLGRTSVSDMGFLLSLNKKGYVPPYVWPCQSPGGYLAELRGEPFYTLPEGEWPAHLRPHTASERADVAQRRACGEAVRAHLLKIAARTPLVSSTAEQVIDFALKVDPARDDLRQSYEAKVAGLVAVLGKFARGGGRLRFADTFGAHVRDELKLGRWLQLTAMAMARRWLETEVVARCRGSQCASMVPQVTEAMAAVNSEKGKVPFELPAAEDGWTALMRASRNGHTETAQALLAVGADTEAKGKEP